MSTALFSNDGVSISSISVWIGASTIIGPIMSDGGQDVPLRTEGGSVSVSVPMLSALDVKL